MAVRPVPSLSEEIASGIARVRRRLIAEADRRLSERGETVLAFQVLSALQHRGRAAQNELAERIGQHPRIQVEPTARGRAFLDHGRPLVDAAIEEVLAPLARAERRTLRDLLWRMLDRSDS